MTKKIITGIKEFYLIPTIACFLISIPLILSRSDYQDDMYRTTSGYTDFWFENARPLAVWIYRIINQGHITPDISPLSFILSLIIILISGLIISDVTFNNKNLKICSTILFFSSPFLTSILSYKYDCLTVSIAILLAVIYGTYQTKRKILLFTIRMVLIFSIFCIYQPVISLVLGLIGLTIINQKNGVYETIRSILEKTSPIAISFIVYKKTISDIFLNEYFKVQGKIISPDMAGLRLMKENIIGYIHVINNFLLEPYVITPLILCSVYAIINLITIKDRKLIISVIAATPFIFFSFVSCNVILQNAAFQAREILGFPIIFICIMKIINAKQKPRLLPIVFILTSGVFITNTVVSYTYLNFKDEMARRDLSITNDIKSTLNHYGIDNIKRINIIYSKTPYTDKQSNMATAYPIINNMIYDNGFSNLWYAKAYISEIYGIKIPMTESLSSSDLSGYKTCSSNSSFNHGTVTLSIVKNCNL